MQGPGPTVVTGRIPGAQVIPRGMAARNALLGRPSAETSRYEGACSPNEAPCRSSRSASTAGCSLPITCEVFRPVAGHCGLAARRGCHAPFLQSPCRASRACTCSRKRRTLSAENKPLRRRTPRRPNSSSCSEVMIEVPGMCVSQMKTPRGRYPVLTAKPEPSIYRGGTAATARRGERAVMLADGQPAVNIRASQRDNGIESWA